MLAMAGEGASSLLMEPSTSGSHAVDGAEMVMPLLAVAKTAERRVWPLRLDRPQGWCLLLDVLSDLDIALGRV